MSIARLPTPNNYTTKDQKNEAIWQANQNQSPKRQVWEVLLAATLYTVDRIVFFALPMHIFNAGIGMSTSFVQNVRTHPHVIINDQRGSSFRVVSMEVNLLCRKIYGPVGANGLLQR